MSDTTKRGKVLREMHEGLYETCDVLDAMADEIVRLSERLAAVEAERDEPTYVPEGHQSQAERELVVALRTIQRVSVERDAAFRILAALREPSDGVVEKAASTMHDASEPDGDCRIAWEDCIPWYHITRRKMATAAIRAAVDAAEQVVHNPEAQ